MEFQWNDENIREWALLVSKKFNNPNENGGWKGYEIEVDTFKKSKEPKRDYEILSYSYNNLIYTKNNLGEFSTGFDASVHLLILHPENMTEIHSVKRLSDGQVFSVDEKVYLKESDGKGVFYINEFTIKDGQCFASSGINIMQLGKAKKVLFTTEDGKEVYNEDNVFLLCTKTWHKSPAISAPKDPFSDDGRIKYFSTEKAREEYILMNKPILSLNDLIIVWDGDRLVGLSEHYKSSPMFQIFKELAKSKL